MVLRYVADEVAMYADDMAVRVGCQLAGSLGAGVAAAGRPAGSRRASAAEHPEVTLRGHRRLLPACLHAPAHLRLPPPRCPPQGEAKRALLASLTRSLGEVLPFLERMLEANFGAAGQAVAAGNRAAAQLHVAVIQAALAAANTYSGGSAGGRAGLAHQRRTSACILAWLAAAGNAAPPRASCAHRTAHHTPAEWVPVGRLKDAGLVHACGFMLNTTEFRDAAVDVMRQVAGALLLCREGAARCGSAWRRRSAAAAPGQQLWMWSDGGGGCADGVSGPGGGSVQMASCRAARGPATTPLTAAFALPRPAHHPSPAGRKQGDESPEVFRGVLEQIGDALIAAAAALLSPAAVVRGRAWQAGWPCLAAGDLAVCHLTCLRLSHCLPARLHPRR